MSTELNRDRIELLQGTLDLLILRTLRLGPAHGHAIVKAIERGSEEVLLVEQGSLYPALHRLIRRGLITFEDGTSENNRRAKYYRLTAKGRKQLETETTKWDRLAARHWPHPPSRTAGVDGHETSNGAPTAGSDCVHRAGSGGTNGRADCHSPCETRQ